MSTDPIKELIYAETFYPFEIVHKKRGVYRIVDREFCWVSPVGVYVVTTDATGRRAQEILNPAMIEKLRTYEEAGQ
jgi:hypothetical protein